LSFTSPFLEKHLNNSLLDRSYSRTWIFENSSVSLRIQLERKLDHLEKSPFWFHYLESCTSHGPIGAPPRIPEGTLDVQGCIRLGKVGLGRLG
jgi:hypothetical protein